MSSHLSDFVLLYNRFGIECKVNKENGGYYIKLVNTFYKKNDEDTFSPYFDGHEGFYTVLHFDHEGQFLLQEFLE